MSSKRFWTVGCVVAIVGVVLIAGSAAAAPKIYWSTDTPLTVPVPDVTSSDQQVASSRIVVPAEDLEAISDVNVILWWETDKQVVLYDGVLEEFLRKSLTIKLSAAVVVECGTPSATGSNSCTTPVWNGVVLDDDAITNVGEYSSGKCRPVGNLSAFNGWNTNGNWDLQFIQPASPGGNFALISQCGSSMTLKAWGLLFNGNLNDLATENTLSVPWYVDNAGVAQGLPPLDGKMTTVIYLNNTRSTTFLGFAEYYTANGVHIGPFQQNAFVIAPNATVAFRPVANDPSSVSRGQEADAGLAVPNRPVNTDNGNDGKQNGSLVIRWLGTPGDLVGTQKAWMKNGFESSSLLPAGVATE